MKDQNRLSTSDIAEAGRDVERDVEHPVSHAAARVADETPAALFAPETSEGYRTRWSAVQTGFVDEPRKAVEEADALVAEVMKQLAEAFADARQQLESQWERAERVSTEDLRQAMRSYRSFFERLLSV